MYSQDGIPRKKKIKDPKDKIDFEKKLNEAFKGRQEKIDDLKKQIMIFITKNQIDDRDAKAALRDALRELKERCEIDKV